MPMSDTTSLKIAMLGHKRIPSREGGVEIVVEELSTHMAELGHSVTCYNRKGHHVSGKDQPSTEKGLPHFRLLFSHRFLPLSAITILSIITLKVPAS